MKHVKHSIILGLALLGLASAQSTGVTVQALNLNSTSLMRSVLPMGNVPPMVQIFIYDNAGNSGYSVVVVYHTADGAAHTAIQTQLAAAQSFTPSVGGPQNVTLVSLLMDAAVINSIQVLPLVFTGASYYAPPSQ